MCVLTLLLGGSMISSMGMTTATLERGSSIDVAQDSGGIIALSDGTSGDLVEFADDELTIDFTNACASCGVTVGSVYELGRPGDPTSEHAFRLTNRDTATHTVTIEYTVADGSGVGTAGNNIEFRLYDSDGTPVATASEEKSGSFTARNDESFYAVVIVDTRGLPDGPDADLSGTLRVTAT